MKTPGEILRRGREEHGWSIEEASRITCISKSQIQHLENNDFSEFSDIFARGYLRNYARELGCDSLKVLRAFEQIRTHDSQASSLSLSKTQNKSRKKKTDYRRIGLFLFLLLATVLGVGVFALSNATAVDPASFPEEQQIDSETKENVRKTRWLLEQPENDPDRLRR